MHTRTRTFDGIRVVAGIALAVAVLSGCAAAPTADPLADGQDPSWQADDGLAGPDAVFTDPPEHESTQSVVPAVEEEAAAAAGSSGSSSGSSSSSSSSGASPSVSLSQGSECTTQQCIDRGPAPDYYYAIRLSGFAPNSSVSVTCYTGGSSPWSFSPGSWTTDSSGSATSGPACYGEVGPASRWVVAGGVTSNTATW